MRPSDNILRRLAETGLHQGGLAAAGKLMWRAVLLGTALYLILGNDPDANLKLNGVSYIAAVVWSYYDGVFAKRMWSIAFLEAIFLHLAGIQAGNLLATIFGNPLSGS